MTIYVCFQFLLDIRQHIKHDFKCTNTFSKIFELDGAYVNWTYGRI